MWVGWTSRKYFMFSKCLFLLCFPQVKKVKDVVRNLDSQVKTGVLSWTM